MLVIASIMLRIKAPTNNAHHQNNQRLEHRSEPPDRRSAFRLRRYRPCAMNITSSLPVSSPTAQQMRGQRRKLPGLRQRPRDAFAALHALRHSLQRSRRCAGYSESRARCRSIAPAARWPRPASTWRARIAPSPPCAAHRPASASSAGVSHHIAPAAVRM